MSPDENQPAASGPGTEAEKRIVEARMKLRSRFFDKMKATPGAADGKPLGSGPPNRHGMPTVPIGQHVTQGWPVLDLGTKPDVPLDRWSLRVDGAVEEPLTLTWKDFLALPQVEDVSDFHCVTTWSKLDVEWEGVAFATVAALARPRQDATHVLVYGSDGYTTNLPLEEALKDDVLLVHTAEGNPLPREHGGPVRMLEVHQLHVGLPQAVRLQRPQQEEEGVRSASGGDLLALQLGDALHR